MTNSPIPYLEDVVGYGVPVDASTVLLLVNVVGHADLLPEARKLIILICLQKYLKVRRSENIQSR